MIPAHFILVDIGPIVLLFFKPCSCTLKCNLLQTPRSWGFCGFVRILAAAVIPMETELPVATEVPCIAEIQSVSIFVAAQPSADSEASQDATLVTTGALLVFALPSPAPDARPQYYFELNSWSYALAGQPALRAASGLYIMPNTEDPAALPFILEAPAGAEAFLDDIFQQATQLRDQGEPLSDPVPVPLVPSDAPVTDVTPGVTDTGIPGGIVKTGEIIATGTVYAAGLLGKSLRWCVLAVGSFQF